MLALHIAGLLWSHLGQPFPALLFHAFLADVSIVVKLRCELAFPETFAPNLSTFSHLLKR